jgi:hypothetical protein
MDGAGWFWSWVGNVDVLRCTWSQIGLDAQKVDILQRARRGWDAWISYIVPSTAGFCADQSGTMMIIVNTRLICFAFSCREIEGILYSSD